MELRRTDLELEVIVRRIVDGEIDLQPEYQRGEVWNIERRQRLIDTILRGWYVPAVHLLTRDDDTRESVLDGQQRLAAIRDFFADELTVNGFIPPELGLLRELHNRRFSQLDEDTRRRVRRYPLTVVTLAQFEPSEPFELFFRLNQQAALTPSEKRNALFGGARDQVREVVNTLGERGLLTPQVVGFSNNRLGYDDVIARVCLALHFEDLRAQLTNQRLESFYREEQFPRALLDQVIDSTSQLLYEIQSEQLRFNKASLFSWLVLSCVATLEHLGPKIRPLVSLVQKFRKEGTRQFDLLESRFVPVFVPDFVLADLLGLYTDRASFRVTDVRSVLIRDFVLHALLYSVSPDATPFARKVTEVLERVDTRPVSDSTLIAALDFVEWGQLRW